ncbi:MAG: altronate dehydratase [Acidobacteria bacterium]|nr:altronate dehydratase [Acidobacteriota bacterium]
MELVTLQGKVKTDNPLLRLARRDNVAVARANLEAGAVISFEGGELRLQAAVPAGHKVAIADIAEGETVYKYGEEIGTARQAIRRGDWVHTHNLKFDVKERDWAFSTNVSDLHDIPLAEPATFWGYLRADGRVGTRNYIAVAGASNCAAHAVSEIEAAFRAEDFSGSNIDGVVCFPHGDGCGQSEGPDTEQLRRTIDGVMNHPNVAAAVIVGLGCEVNQVSYYLQEGNGNRRGLTLQESGGTRNVVRDGVKAARELMDRVGRLERVETPVEKLILGTNCGGSDGFSGITANPALGYCSDLLVKRGGTSVLAETTEIYGAEHLLTRRAVSREIGEKLLRQIEWYKKYVGWFGASFDDNPSPGNKAGGLTNIAEKSLGAAIKSGTSPMTDVVDFSERITKPGFVFMNTPGHDPVSLTGLAAGGANIMIFTTGRGSAIGFPTVPVIKVATNSRMARHMQSNMDLNAGVIADGEEDIRQVGERMYRFMVEVASGCRTFSEQLGHREFVPWRIGPVM